MSTRFFRALIVAALWTWSMSPAHAQKMYRCGNSFQDVPCAGAQQGKVVGSVGTPSAGGASAPAKDGQCAQRGIDAQKIVWMRDNGASKDRQISDLDSKSISDARRQEETRLIESVYRKRGSAPEMRVAIEAECIAEKERFAQAAALAAAALRLQGDASAAPPAPARAGGDPDLARLQARQSEEINSNEDSFKASRCADVARQVESLRREERAGGSVSTMNRLNERRRALDDRRRSEGC